MSVRPALAKLNHSDVRQRRRAVRHLFELDDAEALGGFIKLLEDPDPWFREKAMEAIDRWAASKDLTLIERLAASPKDSRRLLAARIANRANKAGLSVLTGLCSDDGPSIRLAAWQSRMELDEEAVTAGLESADRAVRKSAVSRLSLRGEVDGNLLLRLLNDDSEAVRNATLTIIEENSASPSENLSGRLAELGGTSTGETKARIAALLITDSPESLNDWISDSDTAFVSRFAKTLRQADWASVGGLPAQLQAKASEALLERILRGERNAEAVTLRDSLLSDEARSPEHRSRLIEDMIGRPVPDSTLEIVKSLTESEDVLIASSANNLLSELSA
jgi:hypothetical protein